MNLYICTGNLTKKPELKYLPSGTPVAKFDIAINTKIKDKTETIFWKCNIFGKMAEVANQYLDKGSKVGISARVIENKWTGQDGKIRYSKELIVEKLEFLSSKPNNNQTPKQETQTPPSIDIDEDEIPF